MSHESLMRVTRIMACYLQNFINFCLNKWFLSFNKRTQWYFLSLHSNAGHLCWHGNQNFFENLKIIYFFIDFLKFRNILDVWLTWKKKIIANLVQTNPIIQQSHVFKFLSDSKRLQEKSYSQTELVPILRYVFDAF